MNNDEMYEVIILMEHDFRESENPSFFFASREKAYEFMETCLDNQYIITIIKK